MTVSPGAPSGDREQRVAASDVRARLDATAAGQQRIVDLLTTLIAGQED